MQRNSFAVGIMMEAVIHNVRRLRMQRSPMRKSLRIKIDDDLQSLRNEKHLIACFQSDPHPLYNRRFLEVYFAQDLS